MQYKRNMTQLGASVKNDVINYSYDEVDGNEYRMYFKDISFGDFDCLFIRVVNDEVGQEPLIYFSDHDDLKTGFLELTELDAPTLIKVLNQIKNKSQEKEKWIDMINGCFEKGLDVSSNFAVQSIKDNLLDQSVDDATCLIGEVGLSKMDNGELALSVFFPDKEDPACSHDKPLKELKLEELKCIYYSM